MQDPEEQQAAVNKQRALHLAQWQADLTWLMQNEAGKRIIAHFATEVRKHPFTGDERITSYNLGRFELVRDFFDSLRAANLDLFQKAERIAYEKKP